MNRSIILLVVIMALFLGYHHSTRKTDEQIIDDKQAQIVNKERELEIKHDSITQTVINYAKKNKEFHQYQEDSLIKELEKTKSKNKELKNMTSKFKSKSDELSHKYVTAVEEKELMKRQIIEEKMKNEKILASQPQIKQDTTNYKIQQVYATETISETGHIFLTTSEKPKCDSYKKNNFIKRIFRKSEAK